VKRGEEKYWEKEGRGMMEGKLKINVKNLYIHRRPKMRAYREAKITA
jgi:hypothetical protein